MLKANTVENTQPGRAQVQDQASPQASTQDPARTEPADAAALAESVQHANSVNITKKDSDDFEWSVENPAVLFWDRAAIAVYRCVTDQIVIREEARWFETEDRCITIERGDVPALIRKLEELGRDWD